MATKIMEIQNELDDLHGSLLWGLRPQDKQIPDTLELFKREIVSNLSEKSKLQKKQPSKVFWKGFKNTLHHISAWHHFFKQTDVHLWPDCHLGSSLLNFTINALLIFCFKLIYTNTWCQFKTIYQTLIAAAILLVTEYATIPIIRGLYQTQIELNKTDSANRAADRHFMESVGRLDTDRVFLVSSAKDYFYEVHAAVYQKVGTIEQLFKESIEFPRMQIETVLKNLKNEKYEIMNASDEIYPDKDQIILGINSQIDDLRNQYSKASAVEIGLKTSLDGVKTKLAGFKMTVDSISTFAGQIEQRETKLARLAGYGVAIEKILESQSNRQLDLGLQIKEISYYLNDIQVALKDFQQKALPQAEIYIKTKQLTATATA